MAAIGVLALLTLVEWAEIAIRWSEAAPKLAADYSILMLATRNWLTGDGFYFAFQFAGPYDWPDGVILYPPTILVLFVPFVILPAILWWVIPMSAVGWVVWRLRPRPLAWVAIFMCLWFPTTAEIVWAGNPGMWFVAALALAVLGRWTAVLIFIKPTLAPFAFVGAWTRSWWVALAALVAVSLLFLPLWVDYVKVMGNFQSGLLYSLSQVPTMLIPVAAWLGRTRNETGSRRSMGRFAASGV